MKAAAVLAALLTTVLATGCVTTRNYDDTGSPKEAAHYNVQLGIGYMQQGNYDLAMRKLQRALKEDPELPEAHTSLALLYEKIGDADRADEQYRRALDLAPDDPETQNGYGVFLCRHGKVSESEQYFLNAARNPTYPTPEAAYTNAGICLLRIQKKDRAEADFRLALKRQPDYPDALWQLARLSFGEQKYLETRAFLQRFMARNRQLHAEVLWLAARNEHALGAGAEANKYARELIAKFPASPEARLARQLDYDGA